MSGARKPWMAAKQEQKRYEDSDSWEGESSDDDENAYDAAKRTNATSAKRTFDTFFTKPQLNAAPQQRVFKEAEELSKSDLTPLIELYVRDISALHQAYLDTYASLREQNELFATHVDVHEYDKACQLIPKIKSAIETVSRLDASVRSSVSHVQKLVRIAQLGTIDDAAVEAQKSSLVTDLIATHVDEPYSKIIGQLTACETDIRLHTQRRKYIDDIDAVKTQLADFKERVETIEQSLKALDDIHEAQIALRAEAKTDHAGAGASQKPGFVRVSLDGKQQLGELSEKDQKNIRIFCNLPPALLENMVNNKLTRESAGYRIMSAAQAATLPLRDAVVSEIETKAKAAAESKAVSADPRAALMAALNKKPTLRKSAQLTEAPATALSPQAALMAAIKGGAALRKGGAPRKAPVRAPKPPSKLTMQEELQRRLKNRVPAVEAAPPQAAAGAGGAIVVDRVDSPVRAAQKTHVSIDSLKELFKTISQLGNSGDRSLSFLGGKMTMPESIKFPYKAKAEVEKFTKLLAYDADAGVSREQLTEFLSLIFRPQAYKPAIDYLGPFKNAYDENPEQCIALLTTKDSELDLSRFNERVIELRNKLLSIKAPKPALKPKSTAPAFDFGSALQRRTRGAAAATASEDAGSEEKKSAQVARRINKDDPKFAALRKMMGERAPLPARPKLASRAGRLDPSKFGALSAMCAGRVAPQPLVPSRPAPSIRRRRAKPKVAPLTAPQKTQNLRLVKLRSFSLMLAMAKQARHERLSRSEPLVSVAPEPIVMDATVLPSVSPTNEIKAVDVPSVPVVNTAASLDVSDIVDKLHAYSKPGCCFHWRNWMAPAKELKVALAQSRNINAIGVKEAIEAIFECDGSDRRKDRELNPEGTFAKILIQLVKKVNPNSALSPALLVEFKKRLKKAKKPLTGNALLGLIKIELGKVIDEPQAANEFANVPPSQIYAAPVAPVVPDVVVESPIEAEQQVISSPVVTVDEQAESAEAARLEAEQVAQRQAEAEDTRLAAEQAVQEQHAQREAAAISLENQQMSAENLAGVAMRDAQKQQQAALFEASMVQTQTEQEVVQSEAATFVGQILAMASESQAAAQTDALKAQMIAENQAQAEDELIEAELEAASARVAKQKRVEQEAARLAVDKVAQQQAQAELVQPEPEIAPVVMAATASAAAPAPKPAVETEVDATPKEPVVTTAAEPALETKKPPRKRQPLAPIATVSHELSENQVKQLLVAILNDGHARTAYRKNPTDFIQSFAQLQAEVSSSSLNVEGVKGLADYLAAGRHRMTNLGKVRRDALRAYIGLVQSQGVPTPFLPAASAVDVNLKLTKGRSVCSEKEIELLKPVWAITEPSLSATVALSDSDSAEACAGAGGASSVSARTSPASKSSTVFEPVARSEQFVDADLFKQLVADMLAHKGDAKACAKDLRDSYRSGTARFMVDKTNPKAGLPLASANLILADICSSDAIRKRLRHEIMEGSIGAEILPAKVRSGKIRMAGKASLLDNIKAELAKFSAMADVVATP